MDTTQKALAQTDMLEVLACHLAALGSARGLQVCRAWRDAVLADVHDINPTVSLRLRYDTVEAVALGRRLLRRVAQVRGPRERDTHVDVNHKLDDECDDLTRAVALANLTALMSWDTGMAGCVTTLSMCLLRATLDVPPSLHATWMLACDPPLPRLRRLHVEGDIGEYPWPCLGPWITPARMPSLEALKLLEHNAFDIRLQDVLGEAPTLPPTLRTIILDHFRVELDSDHIRIPDLRAATGLRTLVVSGLVGSGDEMAALRDRLASRLPVHAQVRLIWFNADEEHLDMDEWFDGNSVHPDEWVAEGDGADDDADGQGV